MSYSRWLSIDIDSDIFTPADAFQVTGATPSAEDRKAFREGFNCDVYVGDDRQMAGVIDEVASSGGRIEVSGRDKGAWLTDNETETVKASHYTLKTLAEKLIKPTWGIKSVIDSNDANRRLQLGKRDQTKAKKVSFRSSGLSSPRDRIHVDPGDPVWSALERHARRLGLWLWMTADGSLVIDKPNYDQAPKFDFRCYLPGTALARQNNLPTDGWRVTRSLADRCSEIAVLGQSRGTGSATVLGPGTGAQGAKFKATEKDPDLIARGLVRKKILVDSDIIKQSEATARAKYEMGRARVRGLVITLTVPGLRQGNAIFTVDTLATVKIEEADIDGVFWIGQRRFRISRGSERTEMTLYQKGVFLA